MVWMIISLITSIYVDSGNIYDYNNYSDDNIFPPYLWVLRLNIIDSICVDNKNRTQIVRTILRPTQNKDQDIAKQL